MATVDKEAAHGCWMWIGKLNRGGYGKFWMDGRTVQASRAAYLLFVGPVPRGDVVCHNCDANYPPGDRSYRQCANPEHLFLGTPADNSRDMAAKNRSAKGDRHSSRTKPDRIARGAHHRSVTSPETLPRGSKHGMAKLTEENVLAIRDRRAAGESCRRLSIEFGVTATTISYVATRKIWRHV